MEPGAQITAIEYALPEGVVDNARLGKLNPSWDLELLERRTGVKARRFAKEGEYASDLGLKAVCRLLESTRTEPEEIDALLVCTITPDRVVPHNAAVLHGRLGLRADAATFDFTLGCSGFVYGVALAKSLVESMGYRKVVLVTCDTVSRYCHPNDRATIAVFGDGAAATLFEPCLSPRSAILDIALGTDGRYAEKVLIRDSGARALGAKPGSPAVDWMGNVHAGDKLVVDGTAALRFAMRDVPEYVESFLKKNRISVSDIDRVLFHQASRAVLDLLNKRLKVRPEQTFSNLEKIGNTSASSLPILLRDCETEGFLRRGDLTLLVGLGSGFSWGACLVRW
jgi:3-oxoacyl-[acyl-carrier-protein] synthase III